MSAPLLQPDDALRDAASLAFALIRFAEGAAHPLRGTPSGTPRVGDEVYVFGPSSRRVPREDVPKFLAGLPAPAMLYPTTIRGIIALQLLSELSGDRAAGARKEFANQRGGLDEVAHQLGLTAASRVLLRFGDDDRFRFQRSVRAVPRLWRRVLGPGTISPSLREENKRHGATARPGASARRTP